MGEVMNKNYSKMMMIAVISLVSCSGLMGLEIPREDFVAADKNPLKTVVKNYLLSHCAFYSAIAVVSAAGIKVCTGASLKNSLRDFKAINRDLSLKLLKTMPITAPIAVAYGTLQKSMAD